MINASFVLKFVFSRKANFKKRVKDTHSKNKEHKPIVSLSSGEEETNQDMPSVYTDNASCTELGFICFSLLIENLLRRMLMYCKCFKGLHMVEK